MSKPCPIYGKAIYMDCLECDTKLCKENKMANSEYWNKIDKILKTLNFTCYAVSNPRTELETHVYQIPCEHHKEKYYGVIIEVQKDDKFKFTYCNLRMFAKLESNYIYPITSKKHFMKMLNLFNRSMVVLKKEWGDYFDE